MPAPAPAPTVPDPILVVWRARGGAHRLHAVVRDEPDGRASFACGRAGWPSDPPEGGKPPFACPDCVARMNLEMRRRAEAAARRG